MNLSSDDKVVSLVINRLTKEMYNELCASPGELSKRENELFLVEDDDFDVYNKKVINVKQPENPQDAVNLNYLETQYIQNSKLFETIDKNSVYNPITELNLPHGTKYIDNNGIIWKKNVTKNTTQSSAHWRVEVKSGGPYANLWVGWDGNFGWRFYNGSTYVGGRETNELADSLIYYNDDVTPVVYLSASSWNQCDRIVPKTEISACLSSINDSSQLTDVIAALKKLREL